MRHSAMIDMDYVLDKLEDKIDSHPTPVRKSHCEYCSAWLVILEDVLGVGNA